MDGSTYSFREPAGVSHSIRFNGHQFFVVGRRRENGKRKGIQEDSCVQSGHQPAHMGAESRFSGGQPIMDADFYYRPHRDCLCRACEKLLARSREYGDVFQLFYSYGGRLLDSVHHRRAPLSLVTKVFEGSCLIVKKGSSVQYIKNTGR